MFAKDCLYNKIKDVVSIALSIDLPDNRRIWVPPKGRPCWASSNNNRVLTDDEIKTYLGELNYND